MLLSMPAMPAFRCRLPQFFQHHHSSSSITTILLVLTTIFVVLFASPTLATPPKTESTNVPMMEQQQQQLTLSAAEKHCMHIVRGIDELEREFLKNNWSKASRIELLLEEKIKSLRDLVARRKLSEASDLLAELKLMSEEIRAATINQLVDHLLIEIWLWEPAESFAMIANQIGQDKVKIRQQIDKLVDGISIHRKMPEKDVEEYQKLRRFELLCSVSSLLHQHLETVALFNSHGEDELNRWNKLLAGLTILVSDWLEPTLNELKTTEPKLMVKITGWLAETTTAIAEEEGTEMYDPSVQRTLRIIRERDLAAIAEHLKLPGSALNAERILQKGKEEEAKSPVSAKGKAMRWTITLSAMHLMALYVRIEKQLGISPHAFDLHLTIRAELEKQVVADVVPVGILERFYQQGKEVQSKQANRGKLVTFKHDIVHENVGEEVNDHDDEDDEDEDAPLLLASKATNQKTANLPSKVNHGKLVTIGKQHGTGERQVLQADKHHGGNSSHSSKTSLWKLLPKLMNVNVRTGKQERDDESNSTPLLAKWKHEQ